MSVRAKFTCESVTDYEHAEDHKVVTLRAVTDGEGNEGWSKWTPAGELTMNITNPAAFEQFKEGRSYFIDITLAE